MHCVILALVFCTGVVKSDVNDDLKSLTNLFIGKFDNIAQFKNDMKKPQMERHLHLITTSVPEDVPVLIGFKSFYVEQYLNGNISNVIRQRLYTFGIDQRTQQVVLKLYSFVNPEKFLHSPAKSGVFASLTMKDLIYAEGCDVYWTRIENDYYRSKMYNTCIVNISGAEVLIIDRNNLTSNYLTADETWIFYKNQSVLKVYPSPYNMTKVSVETEKKQRQSLYKTEATVTVENNSSQIKDFSSLISVLKNGDQVRYVINSKYCQSNKPSFTMQGGYIKDFEYFFDSVFGPVSYFGFSSSYIEINSTGGYVTVLKEGFVYNNTGVKLKLTTLTLDLSTVVDVTTFNCRFPGPGVLFHGSGKKTSEIGNFQSLSTSLLNGENVRFTADYRSCPPISAGALSGGVIQDYGVTIDGNDINKIEFTQSKVITNYQGSGFVTDIVIGNIYPNGTVTFLASDVQTRTFQPVYKEIIHCELKSSVKLYLIA